MKRIFSIALSLVILFGVLHAIQAHLTHRIYDLQQNKEKLMSDSDSVSTASDSMKINTDEGKRAGSDKD